MVMSPGSVALFPATLFAVLLVYLREDANEARHMIYGLLAANVSAAALGLIVSHHLQGPLAFNPLGLPAEVFVQSPRLFVAGTLTLFLDSILIVLVYEALRRVLRSLWLAIFASLAVVLAFDTLLFVTGGFAEHPAYREILLTGFMGKTAAALIYASALALFLPRSVAALSRAANDARPRLGDLFRVLTYRQRYEELLAQAARDSLTGVYNRGFFDEVLANHVAATRRGGPPVTVMMVDVDHFKRINDGRGHAEGDRALRVIARSLQRAVRGSDIVCRYGGEEFCIILPGTTMGPAAQLASRIREEVPAACAQAGLGDGAPITVTIGVAESPSDGDRVEDLVRAADLRLYRGKGAGRDRVVAA
jgi:diguanylate cyclase (GGDEF)-like protein